MFRLKFSTMLLFGALLVGSPLLAQSPEDPVDRARIERVIKTLASRDHRQIANLIDYPMGRGYPVKPVRNKQECLKRFDEVFDEALLTEIAQSDPKEDWGQVGWRGIIFKNGALWLNDDYKISAVNHETEKGEAIRARLIAEQKRRLPHALREFDKPVLEWTTSKFLIRVDQTGDDYRLVLFKRASHVKPPQVFHQGAFKFDGNMGSFHIDWQSEGKTYRIDASGPDDPGDCLYVYDGLVENSDWPEHPALEQKRLGSLR